MSEEKEKKEDCPLCKVSEDTIKRLKEQEKPDKEQKSPWKFRIIFLIIVLVLGGFIFYQIFWQSSPEFTIEKNGSILDILSDSIEVSSLAPDFVSEDVYGNKITLSEFREKKPVLLVFWATWCGYCAKELPDLKKFAQDHQDEIQVLAVDSGESRETIKNYIQEKNINFPMLLDENRKIWNQYFIRGTPAHFLIGIDGKIVSLRPGLALREDLEIMMTMLTELW